MIDPGEDAFCAHMRMLAVKGGAVTKRRYGNDPRYYRNVGRRGGLASAAARKAKLAARLETATDAEAPIAESINTPSDTLPISRRRSVTIADIRAERERLGPYRAEVSERQRILDAMAEETMARVLAQARDSHDLEPFDTWD